MTKPEIDEVRRQIVDLLPRLRRFGRALTGDRDRGDDLVQETCLKALMRLDQWERGTRLDSWLYRIAQNTWIDAIRANKSRGEAVTIEDALHLAGEDGREVTDVRLDLGDVERSMALLPPDQRIAVGLVCIEGLSYLEAAGVMQVPIGTLMSRLARARKALFVAIHGEPDGAGLSKEKSRA